MVTQMIKVEIETKDVNLPGYVYRPTGSGPWPAVLIFMDGPASGLQCSKSASGSATYGYFVLLPDLFYRSGPYEPMDPHVRLQ